MKDKFLKMAASVTAALALCSCASVGPSGHVELTQDEKIVLMENARCSVVDSKRARLSPLEKQWIKSHDPEMRFDYTGDKEGRAFVSWQLKDKMVSLENNGKFNDKDSKWRMSITDTDSVKVYRKGEKPPPFTPPGEIEQAPSKPAPKSAAKQNKKKI